MTLSKTWRKTARFRLDGNVIIGGDFNAKTGTHNDFVNDNQDLHSPVMDIDTYITDKPCKRNNRDKHSVDKQGEALLSLCKNNRMRILNGRTKGDRYGKFTRYPLAMRESPSTLDYIIVDTDILPKIMSFIVLSNLGVSDHECLSVSIQSKGFSTPTPRSVPVTKKVPFDYADSEGFLLKISSPIGKEKINKLLEQGEVDVNKMASDVIELITFASTGPSNLKRRTGKKNKHLNKKAPWYTSECIAIKWSLNRALKGYRKDPFKHKQKFRSVQR